MSDAPTRPDRSHAVKQRIRASARRLFTERGFEPTGIRDIAADAEVNPAIVLRHFGSKERLFIETVDARGAWTAVLDGPVEEIGRRLVRMLIEGRAGGLDVFGTVVRASGRPDIHAAFRDSIQTQLVAPIARALDAPDAELRAHLFTAQLMGLMLALVVYDDDELRQTPVDEVVERYGGALQAFLTG